MKRSLMVVIIIIITGLVLFLVTGIVIKANKSKVAKDRINTLPVFSLAALNDSIFCSGQIKEGPVLVLFFHPECEHCQYQIASLLKNKADMSGVHILMISNAEKEEIRKFMSEINLSNYPGLIVLVDKNHNFRDWFGTELVPATFIYNNKKKLVRYFQGEVRPETILKYLSQND